MIIALTRDLIFSAKINEICKQNDKQVQIVRDELTLQQALAQNTPQHLIFDLNARGIDVFAAIQSSRDTKANTLAFFSHVDEELKTKALELGVQKVVPRSKFESELGKLLNA